MKHSYNGWQLGSYEVTEDGSVGVEMCAGEPSETTCLQL
jgi:hypothetical protein